METLTKQQMMLLFFAWTGLFALDRWEGISAEDVETASLLLTWGVPLIVETITTEG